VIDRQRGRSAVWGAAPTALVIWNAAMTPSSHESHLRGRPLPLLRAAATIAVMASSIEALTAEIRAFRDARDWRQFHNPKELAVAITAEAGELLQHFVWQTPEQSERRIEDRRADIASEIADVAILLFELADNSGIDLEAAMRIKLARNEERYPVDKAKGSNAKYNEL
jgi:NTP pyrophosphatase (non-canonical NTP hydrolase)